MIDTNEAAVSLKAEIHMPAAACQLPLPVYVCYVKKECEMKNNKLFAAAAIGFALLLSACGASAGSSHEGEQPSAGPEKETLSDTVYEKGFGAYTVPAGWEEAGAYSTEDKFFYVLAGTEGEQYPDNISINIGKNKYAKDDHLNFRDAIVAQLAAQLSGQAETTLEGDGSTTEKGDILYTFRMADEQSGVVTTQYYVVGDYQYCLIHETNFSGSEDADTAAKAMADSFSWKD